MQCQLLCVEKTGNYGRDQVFRQPKGEVALRYSVVKLPHCMMGLFQKPHQPALCAGANP